MVCFQRVIVASCRIAVGLSRAAEVSEGGRIALILLFAIAIVAGVLFAIAYSTRQSRRQALPHLPNDSIIVPLQDNEMYDRGLDGTTMLPCSPMECV